MAHRAKLGLVVFLSTPSARRATLWYRMRPRGAANFYPRPPRGGRPLANLDGRSPDLISIHALREEGDGRAAGVVPPVGLISIHALREEGDM